MHETRIVKDDALAHHIGYKLLGPVIHRWLLALDQHIGYLDDGKTKFLFTARAGLRIQSLYALYLEGLGRPMTPNAEMFWVSRLALCKATYHRNPKLAASIVSSEYHDEPLRALIKGLFRNEPELLGTCDLSSRDLDAHGHNFPGWLTTSSRTTKIVLDYLKTCGTAFDAHLDALLNGKSRAVMIDSGWQGTGQSLLHHGRSDVEWMGLYLGRILTPCHDRAITDKVIGLLFQADRYDPTVPETAIVLHRHLFESLLEPSGPSIEEIVGGPCDAAAKRQIAANLAAEVTPERDPQYLLVQQYLRDHAEFGPADILARHQEAMPKLARMLAEPSADEALALSGKDRSADFGKELEVPVLFTGDTSDDPDFYAEKDSRIEKALWPMGQIALEYDGKIRAELQQRASGLTSNQSYFDPMAKDAASIAMSAELPSRPLVAVITRTKNRPLLLKRAAESVSKQSYDNYLWVIVNDGGDEQAVRDIIETCAVDRRRIRLVSNESSLGMEAASNAGINAVSSDYVLIHDDDDSLHPDFLRKTVTFLESNAGSRYGGTITGTDYVSEEIRGDTVVVHDRAPFMGWVRNIQLAELMAQNLFAPIAFLYRRSIYDEIGGYNVTLPVLGDWYFNLEFVLRADIKVLPETLAYYHHRDRGDSSRSGVYSNSVIGGQSKHEEYASVFRNMFLRQYAQNNAVAASLVSGYYAMDLRNRIGNIGTQGQSPAPQHTDSNQIGAFSSDVEYLYHESDRLWLLSHILQQESGWRGFVTLGKRRPTLDAPLDSLAQRARSLRIGIAPPPNFDETLYLKNNLDVSEACNKGQFHSGFEHYIMEGRKEARPRTSRNN